MNLPLFTIPAFNLPSLFVIAGPLLLLSLGLVPDHISNPIGRRFAKLASRVAIAAALLLVLIAASLLAMLTAWLLVTRAGHLADAPMLALVFLDLHAHGYDLGLVFFGVACLMMGALVWRSGLFARVFGAGLGIAGLVYLTGSGLRFFAPGLSPAFPPAYMLPVLAETAFCIRLLAHRA